MTTAIKFHNQSCFGAIEINDIVSNCFLTLKPDRI